MTDELVCWKCGAALSELPLPLARLAECLACRAELHVCRMCEFFDPRVAKSCREPVAEEVQDKERANFCGYFVARPGAHVPRDDSAADAARAELDRLFGGASGTEAPAETAGEAQQQLDALFGAKGDEPDR